MKLWTWIGARWATSAASNWLLIIGILAVSGFAVWVQQLRVDAAECKASAKAQEQYSELVKRYTDQIKEKSSAEVKSIEEANADCLDLDLSELYDSPE